MSKMYKSFFAFLLAVILFFVHTVSVFFWGIFASNLILDILRFMVWLITNMLARIEVIMGGVNPFLVIYALLIAASGLLMAVEVFKRVKRYLK